MTPLYPFCSFDTISLRDFEYFLRGEHNASSSRAPNQSVRDTALALCFSVDSFFRGLVSLRVCWQTASGLEEVLVQRTGFCSALVVNDCSGPIQTVISS